MEKITIHYHLLIPTLLSFFVLIFIFFNKKKLFLKKKELIISIIVFFILYFLIVASATCTDIYAQWNLNKYDLNKDGFFSGNEITPEQEEAMKKLINDTGRNLSSITGLFFSGIMSLFVFISRKIAKHIRNNA